MQTDGRMDVCTDMIKLTVAFRNFVNMPKNKNEKLLLFISELLPHCSQCF
jgi:hypothetical protein